MNGVCDTYCEGCEYLAKSSDVYCDYNSIVGHSRPCRAGKECTVRIRPAKYRHDPRLENLEKATLEAMKAEKKKPKPKHDRTGRPSDYDGVSLSPEYLAKKMANRRERILREGKLEAEARAIKEWRAARGLTQKQLGALVGLSGSAVFGWEKGINGAPWEELEKLGCVRPAAS